MAGNGGNLGNLFFTLGIKVGDVEGFDKFMKELDKPKEELSALEKYAKKHLDSLSKANQQYIRELNRIEKAQGKLDFKEYLTSLTREKSGLAETTQWLKQKAAALNAVTAAQSKANRRDVSMSAVNNLTAPKAVDNADYRRRQERLAAAANTELGKQGRLLTQLKTAAGSYISIWTASQFIQSLVRITGEFELQRVSLRAMLNDINAADKIFSQNKALAVESPFQFMDLMGFSKQLAAFSVPVEELFETTKMLSDISAGLGVDMGRIVLAYSQIRSAAVLRGSEVRQLTEAGVPILEDLAKMFTQMEGQAVTIGEVFERISTRQVPFEMVEQAFKNMTSEGGKFYQMQEVQAETLRGQVANLIDAWQIAMYELGSSSEGFLKGAVGLIRSLIENLDLLISAIIGAAQAYGVYSVAAVIVNANNVKAALGLTRLSKALKAVSAVISTHPFVAIAAALAALIPIIVRLIKRSNELKNSLEETAAVNFNKAEESVYGFNKLIKQLTEAEKGSKNYSDAVSALNAKYGEYLPHLLSEADALDVVTSKYESVTQAIYAKAQAQAYEAQMNKISEEYDTDIAESLGNLRDKLVSDLGITKAEASDIISSFKANAVSLFDKGRRFNYEPFNPFPSADAMSIDNAEMEFYRLFDNTVRQYLGKDYTRSFGADKWLRNFLNDMSDRYDDVDLATSLVDNAFGKYNTAEERRRATDIENMYEAAKDAIEADGDLSTAERYNALLDIRIDRLKALRDLYHEMGNTSKEKEYESEIEKILNTDTFGWIQKASEIKDVFAQLYFRPDYKGPFEHFDRWKQDYDDAVEKLSKVGTGNLSDSAIKALENQRDMLNKLSVMLGFGEGFEKYGTTKERQKAEDEEAKKRLDMIRDWIRSIQDLRDIYEEFRQMNVSDSRMSLLFGSMLGEFGRHGMDSTALDFLKNYDFDNAVKVYTDMLRQGTPEMSAYADELDKDALEESMRNRLDELKEAEKISERLQGVYEELAGIMAVSGTGVEHDFSKIVSDLRRQENELRRERDESRKDVQKRFDINKNVDEYNSAMDAVDRLYNAKLENLQANAGEKIRDLASKYVDEQIKANRLDLSDYADKTIRQIQGQLDVLWDIYGAIQNELVGAQGEQSIAEVLGEGIDSTLLSKIEMLKEALAQLGIVIENTEDEKIKKIYDNIGESAKGIASLGSEISSLGADIGNSNLESFGNALSTVGNLASGLVSALSSGNWLGFGINVVTTLFGAIADGIRESYERQVALNDAMLEYQRIMYETQRNLNNTIFGTNDWGLMLDNVQIAFDAISRFRSGMSELVKENADYLSGPYRDILRNSKEVSDMVSGRWFDMGNGTFLNVETEQVYYKNLENFAKGITAAGKSIEEIFNENGWDLYDEDGNINVDALRLFYDTYKDQLDLDGIAKEQFDNNIALLEEYENAVEQVKSNLEALFGDLANSIASSMMDAFLETGEAAFDFQQTMTDIVRSIGTQVVQSYLLDAVLGPYMEQIEALATSGRDDWWNLAGEMVGIIENGLRDVEDALPYIQDALTNAFGDYAGILGQGGENLSEGIKSITEEQAELLASYVNAIRAYVAQIVERAVEQSDYLRTINENINLGLAILKEINGNTAVIKENTDQMGKLMRSLTTSGSSVAINARMM